MSILSRLRDAFLLDPRQQRAALEVRSAPTMFPSYQLNKPQYPKRALSTYDEQGYQRSALIFRCVQYVSNASGAAPVKVYRTVKGEPVEDEENPLRQLLSRPNIGMGESRFLSFITLNLNVSGFCVIEKERDRLGHVIGLWPLRSDWLRWIPRDDGQVDWEYRNPYSGVARILIAEDVIPVTYADVPTGSPTGIGPLEVMLREVGISGALTDFLKSFLDRGALPLYAIVPSDDPHIARQWQDPATQETMKEAWRQRYQGLGNATDPLVLAGAKDVKTIGLNFNELAYPALNDLTDSRICMGFGVSPILIDAQVGLQQSTYNNKTEARRSFYEDTMTYLWSRLDDAFTRYLLPEFFTDSGYNLVFDTSDIPALKDDREKRWQSAMLAYRSGGITMNDYLAEIGLKPKTGGDVFLIPAGVTVVRVEDLPTLGTLSAETESEDDQEEEPVTDEDGSNEPDEEQGEPEDEETERSVRAVPPVPETTLVTTNDVDDAVDWFDETFPNYAGLLDAKVEE